MPEKSREPMSAELSEDYIRHGTHVRRSAAKSAAIDRTLFGKFPKSICEFGGVGKLLPLLVSASRGARRGDTVVYGTREQVEHTGRVSRAARCERIAGARL